MEEDESNTNGNTTSSGGRRSAMENAEEYAAVKIAKLVQDPTQAKSTLEGMFMNLVYTSALKQDDLKQEIISNILRLLHAVPSLAGTLFHGRDPICRGGPGFYPFSFLIRHQADVSALQKVYDLFPDAISHAKLEKRNRFPLHEAITHHLPDEAILFIARQYPKALQYADDKTSGLAINRVLRERKASLTLLQAFVELYPESVAKQVTIHSNTSMPDALGLALQYGYGKDIVDYLVSKYPGSVKEFKISELHANNPVMEEEARTNGLCLDHAKALEKILPQLEVLKCGYRRWWGSGMAHFFTCMEANRSISDLGLEFPGSHFEDNIPDSLARMISNNTTIKTLFMEGKQPEEQDPQIMDALEHGVSASESLEKLHVKSVHLSAETFLCRFLCHGSAPKCTMLSLVSILGPWTSPIPQEQTAIRQPASLRLEVLSITYCTMSFDFLIGLLRYFTRNQSLKTAIFRHIQLEPEEEDAEEIDYALLMDTLAAFIQGAKLHCFALEGRLLDNFASFDPIMDALRRDETMKTLGLIPKTKNKQLEPSLVEILQEHNTSLESIATQDTSIKPDYHGGLDNLSYLLLLNKYGRGKLQTADATVAGLVLLLEQLNEDSCSLEEGGLAHSSVWYGLLRESPSLWSVQRT